MKLNFLSKFRLEEYQTNMVISQEIRQSGKAALATTIKTKKVIESIEGLIAKNAGDEISYKEIVFQIVGDIRAGMDERICIENLQEKRFGWGHEMYEELTEKLEEQNNFLEKPFEIEEGVLECRKCGSKRVFSYSKQVRSSDEGTSVFARCVACNSSWTHSG